MKQNKLQFGICCGLKHDFPQYQKSLDLLKTLNPDFGRVHMTIDDFDSAKIKQHINNLLRIGVKPIIFLGGESNQLRKPAYVARQYKKIMSLYADDCLIQVRNEPNIARHNYTSKEYVAIVKAVSEMRDKHFPGVELISAGLARDNRASYFYNCVHHGLLDYVSRVDLHTYHFLDDALNDIEYMQLIMKGAGKVLLIMISEFGVDGYPGGYYLPDKIMESKKMQEYGRDSYGGGTEQDQAVDLVKWITQFASAGVDIICWSRFVEKKIKKNATHDEHWKMHRGIVRRDYSPKPAFYAYTNMIEKLGGAEYLHKKGMFKNNGNLINVKWWDRSVDMIPGKSKWISRDGTSIYKIYDYLGNLLATHKKKATVCAHPYPVIVEVE